ncbi:hypothetical protein H6P81_007857 [Aristolochia fimbriata]|uniref:Secreted protein n=1 Tax=Aristolochia fimbriata TaxID=158543 RepID=A0AAV7F5X5_ARIFI|nr:hypothetical protein H6P81_007857 [Aristolochia fimbriata]
MALYYDCYFSSGISTAALLLVVVAAAAAGGQQHLRTSSGKNFTSGGVESREVVKLFSGSVIDLLLYPLTGVCALERLLSESDSGLE